jgi:histone-lysine N-methyltransferase EZH2
MADMHPKARITISRCLGTTAAGERCKRYTQKGTRCPQHAASELGIEIKESVVDGFGYGLFTTIDRHRGNNICEYGGELHDEVIQGPYVLQLRKNPPLYIDAAKTNSDGRYANSAKGTGWKNNAQLIYDSKNKKAWVRATTFIPAGHEIFVAYGQGYWRQ